MARISPQDAGGKNVVALLDAIAVSELGPRIIAGSDDGYNVLVGSTPNHILTFQFYASHPNILNRAMNSTAAGRYQLLHRFYGSYAGLLHLTDFSPLAQDRIAIQQIKERGALDLIKQGKFVAALGRISNIWASLPGSQYGQHTNTVAYLADAYKKAGGQICVGA